MYVSLTIPYRVAFKKRVIDWDMSLLKLINTIDNKDKIISIKRITKKKFITANNSAKRINTNNIIIIFKGSELPTRVNIYNGLTYLNIRPYILTVK